MSVEQSKQQWRDRALGGYFFGESIATLNRDDLLAVVGCLLESAEVARLQQSSERETWAALARL